MMNHLRAQHARRRGLAAVAVIAALAALAAGCSGGTSGPSRTSTSVARADAATATQAAVAGPPPTAADVAGFITAGFKGLSISYTAVNIPSFRKPDVLLGVLDDCDKDNAGVGVGKDSPDYWPVVLGHCYTVGDALGWLYQQTNRKEFLYGNLLMKRFNRAKFDEAVAAGAKVGEDYWKLVTGLSTR
jgi:hypothetical protein